MMADEEAVVDPLALQTKNSFILDNCNTDIPVIEAESDELEAQPVARSARPPPLFPITKKMLDRIKQMKRRMLITLALTEDELAERREQRAQQTRESRQRAASAVGRRREADKIIAWAKIRRETETPEQRKARREKSRISKARRRERETPQQKERRMEYQRLYNQNRKPIKFD